MTPNSHEFGYRKVTSNLWLARFASAFHNNEARTLTDSNQHQNAVLQ